MTTACGNTLVLDLGSHSAKSYLKGESIQEVGNITWALLELENTHDHIEKALKQLVDPFRSSCRSILAIGTEAMRRNQELAVKVAKVCETLSISYRTLTQIEEASLILKAFHGKIRTDIINVGGGSIQIISRDTKEITLLNFGISDLNKAFSLNKEPYEREIDECISWVESQLPESLSKFTYTGGEEKYLRHLGVPVLDGECSRQDFERLAKQLSQKPREKLEALSPFEPKWMGGAIASNCIVLACLNRAKVISFVPSDKNIAHGLVSELI
jgi:exopolyphosphatase/pppGpp-phosphohydrolase